MTRSLRGLRRGAAAAGVVLALATAGGAAAATVTPTVTPTPTPTPSPTVVVYGSAVDPGQAVTFPVEDLSGRVEALVFAQASTDGAVTDLGDRTFTLSSDVLFAFDKATLTARARSEIARIAGLLKQQRGADDPVTAVSIVGFTDDQGSNAYNAGLSKRRAAAVRAQLAPRLGSGIRMTSAGRGENDPVATNKTARGRELNRRVEIRAS